EDAEQARFAAGLHRVPVVGFLPALGGNAVEPRGVRADVLLGDRARELAPALRFLGRRDHEGAGRCGLAARRIGVEAGRRRIGRRVYPGSAAGATRRAASEEAKGAAARATAATSPGSGASTRSLSTTRSTGGPAPGTGAAAAPRAPERRNGGAISPGAER